MTIALTTPIRPTRRLFLGVERSVCGRAWRDRLDERGAARALAIAQRHDDVPELLARILAGRGVEADEVRAFLDPTVRALMPDPDVLADMPAAAARLADAVQRGETVAIFGDYDVDGATSAAALACYLRHCGLAPIIHIPDRLFEGYGPNVEAVRTLAARGATLLVAVDCGTTSHAPLAEARTLGLDVVVIDHHLADEELPPALAVVNPNRLDDLSKLGHLAAVGLVFMTIVALNRVLRERGFWTPERPEPDLLDLLDVVALGTVADVVPLKGLNRAFVAKGLIALRRREHVGLTALMDVARLGGPPEPWHLGFLLGPRINAGGRIGRATLGVDLLLAGRSGRSRAAGRRARPPQPRSPGDRAGDLGAGRSRGAGRARRRGEGRGGGHRRRGLASRRGRSGRRPPQGEIRPAGLCDRARARRHRHRLGPLDRRRRSRPRGARGRGRGPARQGRRPRHGGRRHLAQGRARAIPRLYGGRAGAPRWRRRAARMRC